ncbi:MAG: polyprenyl synthetase family protein [Lachnospiraceae bacterium]|nr:polyprenyl synthetase family protein [Lachnospiraceae bacterium]
MAFDFNTEMKKRQDAVNRCIENFLPDEDGLQKIIIEALNYSILAGGKRIRPILIREFYAIFSRKTNPEIEPDFERIEPFMTAMEMIHTYSLVHDDLPAMDNDMLRRGKPTTHAKFGHANGVLAGDALLNYSVETVTKAFAEDDFSGEDCYEDITNVEWNKRVVKAMKLLYTRAGIFGMIGGQTVDVEKTGKPLTADELDFIYELKTCALISASILCGAVLGGAGIKDLAFLEPLGSDIGMAFQIRDDILDIEGDEKVFGKPIGSDEKNCKTTWVTLYGMEKAKEKVKAYTDDALGILDKLPENEFMKAFVKALAERNY